MARARMSRGDLLLLNAVLAAAGAAVAVYLTYEWYTAFESAVCDFNSFFSCSAVGRSSYASIAGVPTSLIGLAGFLILLGLSVASFRGIETVGPWSVDTWTLVFSVVGACVGLGLSLIEVFIIRAVCVLCAAGFALDLGILGVAWKLRRGEDTPGPRPGPEA